MIFGIAIDRLLDLPMMFSMLACCVALLPIFPAKMRERSTVTLLGAALAISLALMIASLRFDPLIEALQTFNRSTTCLLSLVTAAAFCASLRALRLPHEPYRFLKQVALAGFLAGVLGVACVSNDLRVFGLALICASAVVYRYIYVERPGFRANLRMRMTIGDLFILLALGILGLATKTSRIDTAIDELGKISLQMHNGTFSLAIGGLLGVCILCFAAQVPFSRWMDIAIEASLFGTVVVITLVPMIALILAIRFAEVFAHLPVIGTALFVIGVATTLWAIGLRASAVDAKSRFVSEALAQLGFMTACFGLGAFALALVQALMYIGFTSMRGFDLTRIIRHIRSGRNVLPVADGKRKNVAAFAAIVYAAIFACAVPRLQMASGLPTAAAAALACVGYLGSYLRFQAVRRPRVSQMLGALVPIIFASGIYLAILLAFTQMLRWQLPNNRMLPPPVVVILGIACIIAAMSPFRPRLRPALNDTAYVMLLTRRLPLGLSR